MSATFTFTTDATPPNEPVIASSQCSEIAVFEDAGGATGGFIVHEPSDASPGVTYPPGGMHIFRKKAGQDYVKGQSAGTVAALSGSLIMAQVER